ncbi:MAG TPA: hypothetical protein VKU40_18175 [Thermoanaerobaculia bacterium]|nr:hypothetical protein [Thermoanaerobaculia bacterium]
MAARDLSYWDYLKDAFQRTYPVPGLGGLPVNYLGLAAFGVLGLVNPAFWFLGAAAEVVYLTGLAGNGRYQKLVQAERLQAVQRGWESSVEQAVARLQPRSRDRYLRLLAQCREILGISESLDVSLGNMRDLRARSLNQLLGIFLRLLASREAIADTVERLDRAGLAPEVERLEKQLAAVSEDNDALRRSIEGTLTIQQKRMENHERATASLAVVDAELARIEQQVELIREEAAVSGGPEALSHRLDAVTSTMSETTRWMDEQASLIGGLADEGAGSMSDLPRLPDLGGLVGPEDEDEPPPLPGRRTETEG